VGNLENSIVNKKTVVDYFLDNIRLSDIITHQKAKILEVYNGLVLFIKKGCLSFGKFEIIFFKGCRIDFW
jgi:hypothetical protein